MCATNEFSSFIMTSTPDTISQVKRQLTNRTTHHQIIDEFSVNQVSPDPIEIHQRQTRYRRKTIGLFEKSPELKIRSATSGLLVEHKTRVKTSLDKLNSLTRNFNQVHLLGDQCSSSQQEASDNNSVSLIFDNVLSPWNETDRAAILSSSEFLPLRQNYPNQSCPQIEKIKPFMLGNKKFQLLKQIGEGGFARVYKCKYEDKVVALKYQKPACSFEVHIVDLLQSVLPQNFKSFVMSLIDAFIYQDASAIVYEYLPYKTLLELSNAYRIHGTDIYGGIISLIGLQLGSALKYIHQARIIHADLKPDNILICSQIPENTPINKLLEFPLIRLIDFGRAIDMNYFNGKTFTGKAKTQCFDCIEMKDHRPWTYQTDYYGYVATIYTLIHHKYLEVQAENDRNRPKRMVTGAIWVDVFDKFLNIPSCNQIPQWNPILTLLKAELLTLSQSDMSTWKNAVRTLNRMIQFNYGKP